MSKEKNLENVKKLREITGVGFKDCKLALDENNGDIEKSVEYLRKKGIAKASKKMSRTAADGLVLVYEKDNRVAILNIGTEEAKGLSHLQKACDKLSQVDGFFRFLGYVEGNDISEGTTDVVVTDGFTGNVALKLQREPLNC